MSRPIDRHAPLTSGLEITSAIPRPNGTAQFIDAGTLTGLATRDADDVKVLVTCQHVMVDTDADNNYRAAQGTERMYQPFNEQTETGTLVGTDLDAHPVDTSFDAENTADVASCALQSSQPNLVTASFALHEPHGHTTHSLRKVVAGVVDPDTTMTDLLVLGAKTGQTVASVEEVGITRDFSGATFTNVVRLRTTTNTFAGDSGAGVFQRTPQGTYKLVCILFAGFRTGGLTSYAFPARAAQDALSITFGKRVPVAEVSAPEYAATGSTVQLSSTGTRDPDGLPSRNRRNGHSKSQGPLPGKPLSHKTGVPARRDGYI